jgi:shikimate dehydrogenase
MTLASKAPPERITILGIVPDELDRLTADVDRQGRSDVHGEKLTHGSLAREVVPADIVLHCSPIGMHPNDDASLVPPEVLREGLVVFDAVYNPRRTKLLRTAEEVGCRTVEGLEMFLGQAYVQFQLWTDQEAPRDVMRQVVETKL